VRQHLTLAALPTGLPAARARPADGLPISFLDYAQPVSRPLVRRWIVRHRLERSDPADPRSPIRRSIVFYVDRGIPEPIRTATLEGARFGVEAFERAGLGGAFRAELMPPGADPLDLRYNVIQWQNRNEIGWSVGGGLYDPRTGEMLKGAARMDSHRARTAWNLAAALAGAASAADTHLVLGRVRQVTAHEVGHTLGLAHNYIASTYDRGSVMDYPAPRVRLDSLGRIDLSDAYAFGPGAYDVLAIRWGYGIFPPEHERDSLQAILREGLTKRLLFLSDDDARPASASDPRTNLWDDGADPEEFLERQMAVRRAAIRAFGLGNLAPGEPISTLQERFARLYFFHRFAINSVAKIIGGVEYQHALAGTASRRPAVCPPRGSAAVELLGPDLGARHSDTVLTLLGPRPYGYEPTAELPNRTGAVFDELGAAARWRSGLRPLCYSGSGWRGRPSSRRECRADGDCSPDRAGVWDRRRGRATQQSAAVQRGFAGGPIRLAADTAAAPTSAPWRADSSGQAKATARGSGLGHPDARAHWRAWPDRSGAGGTSAGPPCLRSPRWRGPNRRRGGHRSTVSTPVATSAAPYTRSGSPKPAQLLAPGVQTSSATARWRQVSRRVGQGGAESCSAQLSSPDERGASRDGRYRSPLAQNTGISISLARGPMP
jgi:hypothetical protein